MNLFCIIGGPNQITFEELKRFFIDCDNIIEIHYEIDLETYIDTLSQENINVYNIPTNMRTPYGLRPGINKPICFSDIILNDLKSFIDCQMIVSKTIKDIFDFAIENNIHVYFPIVERKKRPTYFKLKDGMVIVPPPGKVNPGTDTKLSELVLNKLLNPIFEKYKRKIVEDLKNCTSYGATYLADPLAVIGSLMKEPKYWTNYSLTSSSIETDGLHTKKIFDNDYHISEKGIPYFKGNFIEDKNGIFHAMNSKQEDFQSSFNTILVDVLNKYEEEEELKIWKNAFISHDAFSCDIDDIVAIELIKYMTNSELIKEYCNWNEISESDNSEIEMSDSPELHTESSEIEMSES